MKKIIIMILTAVMVNGCTVTHNVVLPESQINQITDAIKDIKPQVNVNPVINNNKPPKETKDFVVEAVAAGGHGLGGVAQAAEILYKIFK